MSRRQFINRLSPEEMNCGVRMLEYGVLQRRVAGILNVSQCDIPNGESSSNPQRSFTQTWLRTGQDYHSTSGPFLLIQSRRQWFYNATFLINEFKNGMEVFISTQTVRNRLHEFGLNARRPAILVQLTRQHVQDCLDFARNHVRWTIRDWTPVIFTDESRFCLDFTDRRQLVWRMPKERFDELNAAEHDRYGKSSVMVWQGINVNRKTDLYAIKNGTSTALRYCKEILDQFVRPYVCSLGQDFILMDDNARPHHTHVTNAYLEHETIVHMDWPA